VIAVVVTLAAAQESRDETSTHHVDLPGVAAISVGLGSLVLALVNANAWGWGSPRILGLLALAALALALFAVAERRVAEPIIDFDFFRSRSFFGANVVAFFISFAMLAVFFFLALYLQNIRGYSPLETGVRFLPTTVVIIVVGPIAGRLSDRIGPRPLITLGLLLTAGSLFWQGHLAPDTSYGFLIGAFVLLGLGMGLVMSPMSTAAMNAVDQTKAGVASGVLSMSRMVGGTFGVAAMGALITALGRTRLGELLSGLPAGRRAELADSLGTGGAQLGGRIGAALQDAYVSALNDGLRIAAAVTVLGAVLAFLLIADRAQAPAEEGVEGAVAAAARAHAGEAGGSAVPEAA
jgi:MFS family permease